MDFGLSVGQLCGISSLYRYMNIGIPRLDRKVYDGSNPDSPNAWIRPDIFGEENEDVRYFR
jgi:hypothetical protein